MKLIPFHRKVNLIFGFLLLIITSCQEYEPNLDSWIFKKMI